MTADQPAHRTLGARIYRQLFKVFGPAALGDYHAPANPQPVVQKPCSLCGQPESEHTVDSSREIGRLRCPAPR